MIDFEGNELNIGDSVVFASSTNRLKRGIILSFDMGYWIIVKVGIYQFTTDSNGIMKL